MTATAGLRHEVGAAVLAIAVLALGGQPAGQQPAAGMTRALIREAVETIASVVEREYFDPEVARRTAASVRARLSQGLYDRAATVDALATLVTRDLFDATKDKHLAVTVLADREPRAAALSIEDTREVRGRRDNFDVRRVEILPGNIGYLDLTSFYRLEEAGGTIAAAMRLLQHADAIVLDLRDNGGGNPDTVALLASYQFNDAALPLFEIIPRSGVGGLRYATAEPAVAERNGTRPAYVLTSEHTFSAGEGFAFILQERRRAEVVGERTAGAANPGRPYPVNSRLEVTVPNGRVRTAIAGGNWEGRGVVPDVSVPASDALRTAQVRALGRLIELAPAGAWQSTLKRRLDALQRAGSR